MPFTRCPLTLQADTEAHRAAGVSEVSRVKEEAAEQVGGQEGARGRNYQ
jgi:hypothetical protein